VSAKFSVCGAAGASDRIFWVRLLKSGQNGVPADSIGTFGPAWVTYDPVHNVIV
jgi:hypothetical protein